MSTHPTQAVNTLITEPFTKGETRTYIYAAFAAIAWYNAIELIVLCLASFKRRSGCYFWSLLVTSASIIPHTLGFFLLLFPTGVSVYICLTLSGIGWIGMVTGQSLVLWSRLHLVLQNREVLRSVLSLIIIDAIILHIPTIVLLFGTLATGQDRWADGYNIMEHIQLIWFCMQELLISTLYIWETVKLLRLRPEGPRYSILVQLLSINVVILFLDVAVVVIEYVGLYGTQVMCKPVVYSIKLKLEYAILGKLVTLSRPSYGEEDPSSIGRDIVSSQSPLKSPSSEPRSPEMDHSLPWFWSHP